MARPKKQTVDYFPHDATASNGKTLFILESKFGNDGYAFWFKLLEMLASTAGHVYDYNNSADWQFLLAKTRVNGETAVEILDTLVELGAIDAELYQQKIIWVQNLVDNVSDVYKNRKTNIPQKPSFYEQKPTPAIVSTTENPSDAAVSTDENPQSKLKETKLKESSNYTIIFNHWNSKNIRVHRKLTYDIKQAINARIKDFSLDEILQSIDNYALILHGEEYGLMTYHWTLKEFLTGERVEKFLDLDIAKSNYRKKGKRDYGTHRRGDKESSAARLRKSLE